MYDDYADDYADDYHDDAPPPDDYAGEWYAAPPRRRRLGIDLRIGLGLLAVMLIVILGAGTYYLARYRLGIINSPELTTERFYTALNRRDFDIAADCIVPADKISETAILNADNLLQLLFDLLVVFSADALDIEIPDFSELKFNDPGWEFREMSYTTISRSGDRATVRADGELRAVVMGFEIPLPWHVNHELERIDGDWYLRIIK